MLTATRYTEGPKLPPTCAVCNRDPAHMNSAVAECSHCDCPHRGRAWVGGTGPKPWVKPDTRSALDPLFEKVED